MTEPRHAGADLSVDCRPAADDFVPAITKGATVCRQRMHA